MCRIVYAGQVFVGKTREEARKRMIEYLRNR